MHCIIDSHCHLDFDAFNKDRNEALQRAKTNNITNIIVPGVLRKNWDNIQQLASKSENVHACYGLHPCFVDQHAKADIAALEKQLTSNRCIAVGECGLDFRDGQPEKNLQTEYFEAQLVIADKLNIPVVIHSVHATENVIQILKRHSNLRGMIHSYSGSLEQAMQLVKMGFYISLGGAITYDKATKLRIVAEKVPLDSLLIETDSPDQADAEHYSQRNEPAYLVNTLDCLAELRQESKDEIAKQTSENTRKLFNI